MSYFDYRTQHFELNLEWHHKYSLGAFLSILFYSSWEFFCRSECIIPLALAVLTLKRKRFVLSCNCSSVWERRNLRLKAMFGLPLWKKMQRCFSWEKWYEGSFCYRQVHHWDHWSFVVHLQESLWNLLSTLFLPFTTMPLHFAAVHRIDWLQNKIIISIKNVILRHYFQFMILNCIWHGHLTVLIIALENMSVQ